MKNNCGCGINTYFKRNRTIKNIPVLPQDKDPIQYKGGIIYLYKYGRVDCNEEYIGESGRTFGKRQETSKSTFANSEPLDHHWPPYHHEKLQHNRQGRVWTIKESIYIRVNQPALNRNIGKYNLPNIRMEF